MRTDIIHVLPASNSVNCHYFRSLQSRVESAVSTAEKLWKEHHQNQLQQQLREATPPDSSPSPPTAAAVERAVQEAREKWEEEQQAKIQEALDATKQVHVHVHTYGRWVLVLGLVHDVYSQQKINSGMQCFNAMHNCLRQTVLEKIVVID